MKKILARLLCICMLLSGCTGVPPSPTQANAQTTPSESKEPTQPGIPLLDQGIVMEESENLLYIPNEDIADMLCPEMWLFGNGLLLGSYIRNQYVLKHISLVDGKLLAEFRISASPGVQVYISSGRVGLLDSGTNRILLLSEDLTLLSTQSLETEGDSWYLSPGLDQLYRFYGDQGLLVRDLLTSEERWLVDNAVFTRAIGSNTEYVLFEYTDRTDQRTYVKCLDLTNGILETLPTSAAVLTGIRQGHTWLLQKEGTADSYLLADMDSTSAFTWTDSTVELLSTGHHLLMTDPSGRKLHLYDTQGRLVSGCTLPDAEYGTAGTDLVWSGYWNGYFLTDTIEGICRLMFWDISAQSQGMDLELVPQEQPQKAEPVLDASFYKRAEELSERFGVKILIAEQCAQEYSSYYTYPLTDPSFVTTALDVLEGCMEQYPEDFFRQLPYGTMNHIQIELVGGLMPKDSDANQPDNTAAFVQNQDGYVLVAIDGFLLISDTVYHEFTHLIDRRLEWDALVREDALFSKEDWLALQPDGFSYAMSYTDMPEETAQYAFSGYFVRDYSMTYPTEDRATLFAAAMTQRSMVNQSPGMREKLDYYARCIRDCFDTDSWPETTVWELALK